MRFLIRLLFLMLLGSTPAQADAPPYSAYMNCARAMGVAINEKFAILPGEQAGEKGFFLYTDRGAYFLARGMPRIEDGEAQEYFLRTNLAGVGDIFLAIREKKSERRSIAQSAIGYELTPPRKDPDHYRAAPAVNAYGGQARNALSERLKDKIASVKDFIDDKNSFSTPQAAKAAFERDRVIYRAKLETCSLNGDRDLRLVVSEELQKLESGFPGATIWEIQIGGKPPSIGASKKVSAIY